MKIQKKKYCRFGKARVMDSLKQHLSNYVPRFDAIEIMTLAAGVLFVVGIAIVF